MFQLYFSKNAALLDISIAGLKIGALLEVLTVETVGLVLGAFNLHFTLLNEQIAECSRRQTLTVEVVSITDDPQDYLDITPGCNFKACLRKKEASLESSPSPETKAGCLFSLLNY